MTDTPMRRMDNEAGTSTDPCSAPIDPTAPAGSKNSLGAKSDCNGRPTSDDSVVEAMDEMGPALTPAAPQPRDTRS